MVTGEDIVKELTRLGLPPDADEGNLLLPDEAALMSQLAIETKDNLAVELGTFAGYSAVLMGYTRCLVKGQPIVTVDNGQIEGCLDIAQERVTDFQLENYVKFITANSSDTDKVMPELRGYGQIGLLFIDAGHTYDAVVADFNAYRGKLAKGAYVAFHDYTRIAGVRSAIKDLMLEVTVVENTAVCRWGILS